MRATVCTAARTATAFRLQLPRQQLSRVPLSRQFSRSPLSRQTQQQIIQPTFIPVRPPPRKRFFTLKTIAVGLFITSIGYGLGTTNRFAYPLEPGSKDDRAVSLIFDQLLDKLVIVKELRAESDKWEEHVAYEAYTAPEVRAQLFTSGPLRGSRALGKQLVFRNRETNEVIVVLRVGVGAAGFPGIVHGGLLATLLDETLARVSVMVLNGRPTMTANLDINYRAKTPTGDFIIVRAQPSNIPGQVSTDRKIYVTGSVETLDGHVCVEASGLFIAPKNTSLPDVDDKF